MNLIDLINSKAAQTGDPELIAALEACGVLAKAVEHWQSSWAAGQTELCYAASDNARHALKLAADILNNPYRKEP